MEENFDGLGTRIPSARTVPLVTPNQLDHSSSNVFRSKHCVSREDENSNDIHEHLIINDETTQLPPKRLLQSSSHDLSPTRASLLITPDTIPSLNNSLSDDDTIEPFKGNHSTITALPSISSINIRKDLINTSDSSFSTLHTYQPHMVTGSAVIVRERSPNKSAQNKQRIKSSNQHTNFKTRFVCSLIIRKKKKKAELNKVSFKYLVRCLFNMINLHFHSVWVHE